MTRILICLAQPFGMKIVSRREIIHFGFWFLWDVGRWDMGRGTWNEKGLSKYPSFGCFVNFKINKRFVVILSIPGSDLESA